MSPTIKDSPGLNSPGKPGASPQNAENKSAPSPRSNPVCLEVGVTIRSLPGETGGLPQPIREEGRTVIVFDNGAVLRSSTNLPAGQKVILSNASGREVTCRVATGHNLPNVKGYVEVEFLEPVSDFWKIHQESAPVSAAPPPAPPAPREIPATHPPAPPRAIPTLEATTQPSSVTLGHGPSFEDLPELVTTSNTVVLRGSKAEPPRPAPDKSTKGDSEYSHSEIAGPTALASWDATSSGLPSKVQAIPMNAQPLPPAPPAHAPATVSTHDFLSQGLMAYEKPGSSSRGHGPLILGAAALVLAGVGAVVFVMHRNSAPAPLAKKAVATQPTPAPISTPAASPAPAPALAPVEPPLEEAAKEAGEAAAHSQIPAQPVVADQSQSSPTAAPIPAVMTGPAISDKRPESAAQTKPEPRTARQAGKNVIASKQPDLPASRRPAIPNLKIGSPSAPNPTLAAAGDASAPMTEIASAEAPGAVPPAALLTSSGRTSNPPAPPSAFPSANPTPPSATVPAKTMREAKLVSSVRPVYPQTARESSIQGSVAVLASIDAAGKVVDAKALSGPMMLRQAAVDSVKLWKYSPALVEGKPAPSQVNVTVDFRLN